MSNRYALFIDGKRHDERNFYSRRQCRKAYCIRKGELKGNSFWSIRKVDSPND